MLLIYKYTSIRGDALTKKNGCTNDPESLDSKFKKEVSAVSQEPHLMLLIYEYKRGCTNGKISGAGSASEERYFGP